MKNAAASLALLSFCFVAASCTPSVTPASLVGEWRSDHTLTMKYIRDNIKPEKQADAFLDEIMGRLTLTFTADRVSADMPDWTAHIQGKTYRMAGFHEVAPYTVTSVGGHEISVSSVDQATGKATERTYSFDSNDTMWIKSVGADKALPIQQYREYFKRVR